MEGFFNNLPATLPPLRGFTRCGAERVEYLVLQVDKSPENAADFDVVSDAFTLVRSNASWELWRRDPDVPLPPPAIR